MTTTMTVRAGAITRVLGLDRAIPLAATFPSKPLEVLIVTDRVKAVLRDAMNSKTMVEQGFLLGCSENINTIDRTLSAPFKSCSNTEFVIDAALANGIIHKWTSEGVLFCGITHSHIGGSTTFSAEDIAFAKMLPENFSLPFIWFGVIVRQKNDAIMILKQIYKGFSDLSVLSEYRVVL